MLSSPSLANDQRPATGNVSAPMPSPTTIVRFPRTHRVALICLLLIAVAVNARQMVWYFSHGPVSTDLRIFMTGVEMVRSGQGHQLYGFSAQQAVQHRLYPETRTAGLLPFNHLAYELLFYWPLSWLPYRTALITWAAVNLGLVFLIARLMRPYTEGLRQATGSPLALCLLAFYPLVYVFGEGQDSLLFLLLVVASLRCADAGRGFWAGFALALAFFKFHLVLLIAFFVFLLRREWRGLAGVAAGGILVAFVSLALAGPSLALDYLAMLRKQEEMTPWGFIPWFMPNLRGLLQWGLAPWLDIGSILPLIFLLSAALVVVSAWIVVRCRAHHDATLLYAVAILTTLLVSYHLHMQDLSLAALPLLMLSDRALRGQLPPAWTMALAAAVAGLYGYRLAAEPFQILLVRGCLLAVPLSLLWLVSVWAFCRTGPDGGCRLELRRSSR